MDPDIPEIIHTKVGRAALKRLGRAHRLRKLFPGIYTTNLKDDPAAIVSRNLYPVLGKLFPGAVLSHRTALEGKPSEHGTVFLTYGYTRTVKLPGFTVRLLRGRGALADDMPFVGGLFMSSLPRTFLENLQPCRRRANDAKCLPRGVVEERLDRMAQTRGEGELNRLRDRAREAAVELAMTQEFERLDGIISALLGTRPRDGLQSAAARARALGLPYDQNRLPLFDALFAELRGADLPLIKALPDSGRSVANRAFFESYFSNFIEGTEFDIVVAHDIVFANLIPVTRPRDAHDIIGTFRIVSNTEEMTRVPGMPSEFLALLKARHAVLLGSRPEAGPGEFKQEVNRAGQTTFVAPELVRGTLEKGMEYYQGLEPGPARAIFMLFLVSEVHPFADGNGRIARVMMNAELAHAGLSRILVPIVLRDDYLQALRALSRMSVPASMVRVALHAQRFTASIDFSDYDSALAALQRCHAFAEPGTARLLVTG